MAKKSWIVLLMVGFVLSFVSLGWAATFELKGTSSLGVYPSFNSLLIGPSGNVFIDAENMSRDSSLNKYKPGLTGPNGTFPIGNALWSKDTHADDLAFDKDNGLWVLGTYLWKYGPTTGDLKDTIDYRACGFTPRQVAFNKDNNNLFLMDSKNLMRIIYKNGGWDIARDGQKFAIDFYEYGPWGLEVRTNGEIFVGDPTKIIKYKIINEQLTEINRFVDNTKYLSGGFAMNADGYIYAEQGIHDSNTLKLLKINFNPVNPSIASSLSISKDDFSYYLSFDEQDKYIYTVKGSTSRTLLRYKER